MKITWPAMDIDFLTQTFREKCSDLPDWVQSASKTPANLTLLADEALDIVRLGMVIEPDSPKIGPALRLATQAHAALLVTALAHGDRITVPLGNADWVTYDAEPDESTVHSGRWIRGFYLSALTRDEYSQQLLRQIPTALLRQSSTRYPEFKYMMVETLQAFSRNAPLTSQMIIETLQATDPTRPDIFMPDYVLHFDVPQLELLYYVLKRDPDFGAALPKALELHKKIWTRQEWINRWDGFLSFELLGLAALAYDRGIPFSVESDYLPMSLVRGDVLARSSCLFR